MLDAAIVIAQILPVLILALLAEMREEPLDGPRGWLTTAKRGNTNLYQAVVAEESAIEREIDRFLTEVVGSEPEHVQLLEEAVARHRRRARSRR